jgi:hypothetical protein
MSLKKKKITGGQVKTKMLDSQNDTIAGLKKELVEAKEAARGSASSIKARDAHWMDRLQDEVEQVYMNIISDPDSLLFMFLFVSSLPKTSNSKNFYFKL